MKSCSRRLRVRIAGRFAFFMFHDSIIKASDGANGIQNPTRHASGINFRVESTVCLVAKRARDNCLATWYIFQSDFPLAREHKERPDLGGEGGPISRLYTLNWIKNNNRSKPVELKQLSSMTTRPRKPKITKASMLSGVLAKALSAVVVVVAVID